MAGTPRLARVYSSLMLLAAVSGAAALAGAVPYRLDVDVQYGRPAGPISFSDELQREILTDLERAGCIREIAAPSTPPADDELVFVLTLDDFTDETRFGSTLGERATSDDPSIGRYVLAVAGATVGMELRSAADGAVLRSRHFTQRNSWRPVVDEDPREMARQQLLSQLVRRSRKFVCKGSPAQWEKELQRARSR